MKMVQHPLCHLCTNRLKKSGAIHAISAQHLEQLSDKITDFFLEKEIRYLCIFRIVFKLFWVPLILLVSLIWRIIFQMEFLETKRFANTTYTNG